MEFVYFSDVLNVRFLLAVNISLIINQLKMEHVKMNKCFHQNIVGGVIMIFNVICKVYA